MTFHPYVQLKVGDQPISTIPPKYVNQLVYKSALDAISTLTMTLVDPTYHEIEDLLLLSEKNNEPIYARFGYLDSYGRIASNWIQARMIQYSPRIGTQGMEVTVEALVDTNARIIITEPKAYYGRISNVVSQIAADMGMVACIEETDDDDNEVKEVDARGNQSPKAWTTKNMTLLDYIQKELQPFARAKSSKSNYYVHITGNSKDAAPVMHFHTMNYLGCVGKKRKVKEFTYLAGKQDTVLDFQPTYSSSLLGNIGGKITMRYYDPVTKRYVSKVESIYTNQDVESVGGGSRANVPDFAKDDPTSKTKSQGIVNLRGGSDDQAEAAALAQSRNISDVLFAASFNATLTLVGLPDTVDIEAKDFIRVNFLLPMPVGESPSYRSHWTSGLYLVQEALHDIGSNYTVTCQLMRSRATVGTTEIVGPEVVP